MRGYGKTGSSCRKLLWIWIQISNEMKMKMNFYMLCAHTHIHAHGERDTPTEQPNSLKIRHSFTNNLHIKRLIMNSSWNLIPYYYCRAYFFNVFVMVCIIFFLFHRLSVASTYVYCVELQSLFLSLSHRHSCCFFSCVTHIVTHSYSYS